MLETSQNMNFASMQTVSAEVALKKGSLPQITFDQVAPLGCLGMGGLTETSSIESFSGESSSTENSSAQISSRGSIPGSEDQPPSFSARHSSKAIVTFTQEALKKLEELLWLQKEALGVRIRLRTRGCSGLSYVMEYVQELGGQDQAIPLSFGGTLFIHRQALMFLMGTEVDYQKTATRSGFVFRNPQEKGKCGCGSSFHV